MDRDDREVHRNLAELEGLGVVEFVREGSSKKPVLRGGAETVDFSFRIERGDLGGLPGASA